MTETLKTVPDITIEEVTDFLATAKDIFVCHCFRLMLSKGVTWEEIFSTITVRIPGALDDERGKLIAALQDSATKIDLTPNDFSRLGISLSDFLHQFKLDNWEKFSQKLEGERGK